MARKHWFTYEEEEDRDDCYSCASSEIDEIIKPDIAAMKFANGESVEVTHISELCDIYIRSTANDENYVKLMKLQNSTVFSQKKPSLLDPLKVGNVVLAKFCNDFSRGVVLGNDTLELVDIGAKMKINRDDGFGLLFSS